MGRLHGQASEVSRQRVSAHPLRSNKSVNIILVTRKNGKTGRISLGRRQVFLPLLFLLLLIGGSLMLAGYLWGRVPQRVNEDRDHTLSWKRKLDGGLSAIQASKRAVDLHLDALALRLGQMQAQMVRLNALGQQLTQMADIDDGEFDFNKLPPLGGPAEPLQQGFSSGAEFLQDLEQLSRELQDRERQLTVIETLLMNRNVNKQVLPAGRPVLGGWVSSYFGTRRNPFNGRKEFHSGVDFAGKRDSIVIAVAAGVVTRSEQQAGLGNVVEIDHGNGYLTRYAHNHENLVTRGERITKGQLIAVMGSTGYSTGTHVHFEVYLNGKAVDPARYIQADG